MSAMILTESPVSVVASDILTSETASAGEDLSGQPVQHIEFILNVCFQVIQGIFVLCTGAAYQPLLAL